VYLQLELAAVVDWGEHFVKATYTLEGDGPLGLNCFEVVSTILAAIHAAHCPNVQAAAKKREGKLRGIRLPQLHRYAQGCIQPGLDYFKQKVDTTLKDALAAFKAARLFSPQKVHTMQPKVSNIDCLCVFPFFTKEFLDLLKKELSMYLSKCADTDENFVPWNGGSRMLQLFPTGLWQLLKIYLCSLPPPLLSVYFLCSRHRLTSSWTRHYKTT
jgi:hypothetical protein